MLFNVCNNFPLTTPREQHVFYVKYTPVRPSISIARRKEILIMTDTEFEKTIFQTEDFSEGDTLLLLLRA